MSGAEVIGLISGVISIVTAIKEIYDAVKDKDNIPEAFREVIAKLPLVHDTLEAAKAQIEVEQSAVTGPVENIIRSCQDKAAKLMKLFQKVTPQEDESRTDRYLKAVRRIGKGGRVEVLMRGILQDLQILASNRTMKMNSEAKVQALERAVEEISALKPSVADDEFPEMSNNFSQYGGGNMFNTTGGKNNFNLGEGNTFQGDNQYFDESKREYIHDASIRTHFNANKIYFGAQNGNSRQDTIGRLREECRNEVPMTDPQDDKAAIISRFGPRLDGTCDWIIRKEEYQSWVGDERSSLLWISGGPATGKTYISLFLTSHLEEAVNNASKSSYGKRNELLAYYFCSQQDERCNTAITLLRGLMHLVLQARPNLVDSMLEDFCRLKNHNSLFDPSNKEALWRNFERMLLPSQLDKVYFVVDALDECAEESLDWLLQKLTGLVSVESAKRGPTLKVVITSRAYPEVLQHRLWKFGTITVGQHHNSNHDLRLFISSKIKDLAEKKSSKEGQRRAIVNDEWLKTTKKLMEYTDETFLWFSFVIRDLERCSLSEVEQTLRKLPRGLDRYYDRMIHQFSSLDQPKLEIAARVIRWVAMAVRPLSLLELSIAVDAPRIDYLSREQAMKDIVDQCGYFLKVDHGVVSLIHKSARDYLTSISAASGEHVSNLFRIDEGKAHLEIARACIRHIQGDPKGTSPFMTGRTINLGRGQPDVQCAEMQEFPLLQYAGLHWPEHARCCSEDEVIFDLSVPFFHEQSLVRRAWLHSYWRATMPDWELPGESFGLIHMYAFFGLKSATKELLRQPWPYKYMLTRMANRKSDREMTPLHWAVRNGHENVTKLLLDHGADVDTYGYGLTPLIWAVRNGNKAIVQILLEKAKIDQKGYGMTALHWAALEGRESLLRLLLGRGADSHARTTSQHLDGTFEMVTAESNGEFPWATVEQANLLSRSTKEEDDLLKGKRNVKENLSNGAGALAYVPSYLILFTHVTKPPLLPPPMVWTWSLATTMLVGVVTATAIQGLYFLLWYLSVQGCVILFWTLVYWYCDALQFPYWTAAQSAKCIFSWDHTYHLAFRYLVNFAFHFGILITVQRFNSWVGSYNWTWRPFIVLWWAGCTALAYLDLPLHLLAWATIGFTVAFWGEAILGALNKHPPLGKTAAELAAPRGFVGIVQLLGEREKKHYSFKR